MKNCSQEKKEKYWLKFNWPQSFEHSTRTSASITWIPWLFCFCCSPFCADFSLRCMSWVSSTGRLFLHSYRSLSIINYTPSFCVYTLQFLSSVVLLTFLGHSSSFVYLFNFFFFFSLHRISVVDFIVHFSLFLFHFCRRDSEWLLSHIFYSFSLSFLCTHMHKFLWPSLQHPPLNWMKTLFFSLF